MALKFENPFVRDRYREECFEREAAILEKFKGQKNVLQINDCIAIFPYSIPLPTGGSYPISFRFVSLELARYSLFEYIYGNKKYTPLRSLAYFREICKGVQRLHNAQVCHRDLRPQNCLVMSAKYVVVGDLGTAKTLDGSVPPPNTPYGEPVGHKQYTAPELLCGLDSDTGLAYVSDKYSLGAILFELFTASPLNLYLYSIKDIDDKMISPFSQVQDVKRKEVFDATIGALEAACPLPDIDDVAPDGSIPDCIRPRLNRLYKDLCCLDYRKRTTTFDWLFLQIDIMRKVLVAEIRRLRRERDKARVRAMRQGLAKRVLNQNA
ncbi:protein kinase [Nitrospiraceae bacterium AH_259_D15_M11_P09]|nr:protein kinase [Nitrospiraceae bacterium AH_259_D15_M11_P09]